MKKLFILSVFVLSLLSLSAIANDAKSVSVQKKEVTLQNEKYSLNLGNLQKLSDKEVESRIEHFVNSIPKNEDLTCSLTITGSISVKVVEFEISVTISGPCSEVRAKGKELANQILQEVKNYIKSHF